MRCMDVFSLWATEEQRYVRSNMPSRIDHVNVGDARLVAFDEVIL